MQLDVVFLRQFGDVEVHVLNDMPLALRSRVSSR